MGNSQTTIESTHVDAPSSPVKPAVASSARPSSPVAARTPARNNNNGITNNSTNPPYTPLNPETPAPQDNSWLQIYSPTRTPALNRFRSSDFVLDGKVLGEGSFARVQLATHTATQKKVAVKVIDKTRIPEEMRMYAAREPGILRDLKHPNVVKLLHTEETRCEIQIYLQFMEGCDMHTYVQEHRRLEEREARRLFVQILDAVEYIHSQNVCHRDLKLENILVSKTKRSGTHRAMVIDFGFAGHIPTSSYQFTDHPGSVCYAAPELLAGRPYDGKKVDMYALGVTLYVMIHGCYPFYHTDTRTLYNMIWHDPVVCDPTLCSDSLSNMLMLLLQKNPSKRPTSAHLKSHPWVAGVANPYTTPTVAEQMASSPIVKRLKSVSRKLSPQVRRRSHMAI